MACRAFDSGLFLWNTHTDKHTSRKKTSDRQSQREITIDSFYAENVDVRWNECESRMKKKSFSMQKRASWCVYRVSRQSTDVEENATIDDDSQRRPWHRRLHSFELCLISASREIISRSFIHSRNRSTGGRKKRKNAMKATMLSAEKEFAVDVYSSTIARKTNVFFL